MIFKKLLIVCSKYYGLLKKKGIFQKYTLKYLQIKVYKAWDFFQINLLGFGE